MKKSIYWRKLNHQAKVFSIATTKKYNSIFRLSVVLNENVDKDILMQATKRALDKYISFKVKAKSGLFWNYLVENEKEPIICEETKYPFQKVNTLANNDYLFRVSYYGRKINIEIYHILTDGTRGMIFFKEIVRHYLDIKSGRISSNDMQVIEDYKDVYSEYLKSVEKVRYKKGKSERAYIIKGEKIKKGQISISHFIIDLNSLKEKAKTKNVTIGIYMTAILIYAIYESNYKVYKGKGKIKICIPVNLTKYFNSNTMSNFFTYIMVNIKVKTSKSYSFEDILEATKKEFKIKLVKENLTQTIKTNVALTNNPIIRAVPLFLKKVFVRIGSQEVKRHTTMTISNIGIVDLDEKYKNDIQEFMVMLSPDWTEKIKCGICSYNNKLVLSLSSILKDNMIEKTIYNFLVQSNTRVNIEGNGVKNVISN